MNPFSALTSKIFGGAALALLVVVGVQAIQIKGRDAKIETLTAQNTALVAKHKEAVAKAEAVTLQAEATSREIASAADNRAKEAFANGRAAADQYARNNRVRPGQGPCVYPGPASQGDPAEPADRPGDLPEMVAVPREEFDHLAANTVRLDQIVNVYVPSLIKSGLAVPEPTFAPAP